MKRLNQKQLAFALALFDLRDQGQAAAKAGYTGSLKSLHKRGSELAKDPRIQAELARLRKAVEDTSIATKQESLKLMTRILRFTLADVVDEYGNLDIHKARENGALDLVESYTVEPMTHQGVKLGDKITIKACRKLDANTQLRAELGWDEPIRQHVALEAKVDFSKLCFKDLVAKTQELLKKAKDTQ